MYIHYPFCIQKCSYCDFYSLPLDGELKPDTGAYLNTLEQELSFRRPLFQKLERIETIFFGGGTASLLPVAAIEHILSLLAAQFAFSAEIEITLEGNPEDFTADYLQGLADVGVNRINAGIQTFRPDLLQELGRFYRAESYAELLPRLKNLAPALRSGVDLIYGFANSSQADFLADLGRVLSADLSHLSIYALTVEPGTPLARAAGPGPDEELQSRIFADLPELLAQSGYRQYEVSNFARPGFEARHNLRYWLYEPYLALGPAAHGFNGQLRYGNVRNARKWLAGHFSTPERHEPEKDIWINLLRLTAWMGKNTVQEILAENELPYRPFAECLESWVASGWMREDKERFAWTQQGLLFLDDRIAEVCAAYQR